MPRPVPSRRVRAALALLMLATACDHARRVDGAGPECTRCHGGGALGAAPPRTPLGETSTSARGVGAHEAHLVAGRIAGPVACGECHVVPERVEGHFGDGATVTFGARAGEATWDRASETCSGVYCHGATLGAGGDATEPVWTTVDGSQSECGSCHGNPPPVPHPSNPDCSRCHPATVTAAGAIDVLGGQHLDGELDLGPLGCTSCHGSEANAAPPVASTGEELPSAIPVGAHQSHVTTGALRSALSCADCHEVPTDMRHADGTVELAWSPLAGGASWDRATATCSAVYCHGATLGADGTVTEPVWTTVDGSQAACGTCHGNPPLAPHPSNPDCSRCHPATVTATGAIDVLGGQHVDGELDVSPLGCTSCHGSAANAAPPVASNGETLTSAVAVGAHQAHLTTGTIRSALSCGDCHEVPTGMLHADGAVDLAWSALAGGASWDRATATCSAVYCHGATLDAGGTATEPVWTTVDGSQRACTSCHGNPPPAPHPQAPIGAQCRLCHAATVLDGGAIDVAGGHHVNGELEMAITGACDACHGAPPGGAHLAHATPSGPVAYGSLHVLEDVAADGAEYEFGCGHCHPIDPSRHLDGVPQVDLSPVGAAAGSLKARNAATAGYAGGVCDGVYCHSSGQATPAFAASPAWTATGGLGCDGCHGNPPRYQTDGSGTPGANSHLGLSSDDWESGHFGGMPGPWHTSYHGLAEWGLDAAPITCQTCHDETTDPAAAGPSGFYWLDTTGDYVLPGGLLGFTCTGCHTGAAGEPPVGAGKVRPLRHVNGRRDVAFDPRVALPALPWLPPPPNRPTRPYWVTASPMAGLPAGAVEDGTTMSLHLAGSGWDPATKTCTSVACHLEDTQVVWGGLNDWAVCGTRCHPY